MTTAVLSTEALQEVKGIGPALAKLLADNFGTWADIAAADLRILKKIKGMSITRAAALQAYAMGKASAVSEAPAEPDEEPDFIYVRKQIDKFNSRRVKLKLHPGLCKVCGFDILKHNHSPSWDMLPETEQVKVLGAMKEHMKYHEGRMHDGVQSYL